MRPRHESFPLLYLLTLTSVECLVSHFPKMILPSPIANHSDASLVATYSLLRMGIHLATHVLEITQQQGRGHGAQVLQCRLLPLNLIQFFAHRSFCQWPPLIYGPKGGGRGITPGPPYLSSYDGFHLSGIANEHMQRRQEAQPAKLQKAQWLDALRQAGAVSFASRQQSRAGELQ